MVMAGVYVHMVGKQTRQGVEVRLL